MEKYSINDIIVEKFGDVTVKYDAGLNYKYSFNTKTGLSIRTNVMDGSVVPMTMGSNTLCQGIYTLLDDIVKYFPSPENKECKGISLKTNEIFEADYDFAKAKSAYAEPVQI